MMQDVMVQKGMMQAAHDACSHVYTDGDDSIG